MPVLIILLFYIHDLSKLKRWHDQTEFVAQQMVNMIQNVSQKRAKEAATAEEREALLKISKNDLKNIFCLAWQTVYPGTTMFGTSPVFPFGHVPLVEIYYITSSEQGQASCEWRLGLSTENATSKPSQIYANKFTTDHTACKVRFLKNVPPSSIYPTLKINKGEERIIIETMIMKENSWKNSGGMSALKQILGLYSANPPKTVRNSYNYMFHSIVIFTPQPDLFNKNGPQ